jgi:hypothetical protein
MMPTYLKLLEGFSQLTPSSPTQRLNASVDNSVVCELEIAKVEPVEFLSLSKHAGEKSIRC